MHCLPVGSPLSDIKLLPKLTCRWQCCLVLLWVLAARRRTDPVPWRSPSIKQAYKEMNNDWRSPSRCVFATYNKATTPWSVSLCGPMHVLIKREKKKEGVEPPVIQGPLRCRACAVCNRVSVELCGSAPCQALLLRGPRGAAPVWGGQRVDGPSGSPQSAAASCTDKSPFLPASPALACRLQVTLCVCVRACASCMLPQWAAARLCRGNDHSADLTADRRVCTAN